jgi:hypothetical protein
MKMSPHLKYAQAIKGRVTGRGTGIIDTVHLIEVARAALLQGMEYLYPYLKDKSTWPHAKDVMIFDEWPVREPSLLFSGLALNEPKCLELWKSLNGSPTNEEVIRNLPIRHPSLWVQ